MKNEERKSRRELSPNIAVRMVLGNERRGMNGTRDLVPKYGRICGPICNVCTYTINLEVDLQEKENVTVVFKLGRRREEARSEDSVDLLLVCILHREPDRQPGLG